MKANRTLIRGGEVLVGDPRLGNLERADILVEHGRVIAIQHDLTVDDADMLDATGSWVLPGFVNGHHHLWQATMRGLCADWTLNDYFWCVRRNHAIVHEPDDIYGGTLGSGVALLFMGVTCTTDFSHCIITPEHADESVRAFKELGIRGVWSYGMYSPPREGAPLDDFEARANDARRVRSEHFSAHDDLFQFGISPNEMGVRPWAQTRAEFALATELDALLHTHTNVRWRTQQRPLREIEIWQQHGMLTARHLHAHANTTTADELSILRDVGGGIAGTPDTELGMGIGYTICARSDAAGVPTGIGGDTDCNNSADPFVGMRLVLQSERVREQWPILQTEGLPGIKGVNIKVADVLHMATLGGARALGLGDVCGSIEIGKAADLFLFDAAQPHLRPVVDPVATIVLHGSVADVRAVMVDGKVVKKDGQLTGFNAREVARIADGAGNRVRERVEARGGWNPPRDPVFAKNNENERTANLAGVF